MIKAKTKIIIRISCCLAMLAFSFSARGELPLVKRHPVGVEDSICSMCHTDKHAFDHTPDWEITHRFAASRDERGCVICHKPSFCADCHAMQEEIKPSDKYKESPDSFLPHRGDYLTQHQIDGRINPATCFRCHGRQNNTRCRVCHR